jgi:hypothetical protein
VYVFIALAVWSALRVSDSSPELLPELGSHDLVGDVQQSKLPAGVLAEVRGSRVEIDLKVVRGAAEPTLAPF